MTFSPSTNPKKAFDMSNNNFLRNHNGHSISNGWVVPRRIMVKMPRESKTFIERNTLNNIFRRFRLFLKTGK